MSFLVLSKSINVKIKLSFACIKLAGESENSEMASAEISERGAIPRFLPITKEGDNTSSEEEKEKEEKHKQRFAGGDFRMVGRAHRLAGRSCRRMACLGLNAKN